MKMMLAALLLSTALYSPVFAVERPINELPMYGGKHNPTVEANHEFSSSAAELGWKYYYAGDLDTAMKRFNQAWMFNRENPNAFWGFGVIMGRRAGGEDTEANLRESIKYLEMASTRMPDNARIIADLAFSHVTLGGYLDSKKANAKNEFNTGRDLLRRAEKLDSTYPLVYADWSILEFYSHNYSLAKKYLDKAKKLGYKPDPAYEKALRASSSSKLH